MGPSGPAVAGLNWLLDRTLQPLPVVGPLAFQPEGTVIRRPRSPAISTESFTFLANLNVPPERSSGL